MTSHPIVTSSTLSSVSPRGACPLIDSLTSVSLFAWSQSVTGPVSHPKTSLYLLPSSHHLADYAPSSFCDSVSPVLLGAPHNTPLDKKWTYRIIKRSEPGCYLAATALALPSVEHVSVSIEGVPASAMQLERLQASLYFVMVSANGGDRNFAQQGPIDRVDSVAQVAGYRYAPFLREHEDALVLHYTGDTSEKTNTSLGRILKRYEQLPTTTTTEQGLILNETALDGLSQRFNFLLSVGAFAVLVDHNASSSRTTSGIQARTGPYQRLIRPGTYVSFDGAVRYGQLTLHHLTYQNRAPFLARLTLYPLVVLAEGVSAFDIFYATDGLDATFIDTRPMERLLMLDWHQVMLDFGLGHGHAIKGHILAEEQLTDVLTTCPLSQMTFDWKTAAELNFLEVQQEEETLKSESVRLSLQSVTYNYGNTSSGTLMVTWNAYARIDSEHLTSPSATALYLYLKSYLLSYKWFCESPGKMLQKIESMAFVASESPTRSDLHRARWSPRLYGQWLPVYRSRLEPYSKAIEHWLTAETRRLVGGELTTNGTFHRATPLAEKLAYRNAYFNARIKTMTTATGGKHTGDTLLTTLKPATDGETTAQWKMSK